MTAATPDHSDQGWAALDQARWQDARAHFERILSDSAAEHAPNPLEGLSWAAWWLDDEATVFDARQRAYQGYQAQGDLAGAARMATWLAADHLDFHGAVAVANGWIGRARRALADCEQGLEHGWVAFHEGYLASVARDRERAQALATRTAELGRQLGSADLEMLGLALLGSSLVTRSHVSEGMGHLDEAAALALHSETRLPISKAWTCCFLVSACIKMHDYERAFQWCDRIAEFAQRYDSRYMLAFCRSEYAAIPLWRGEGALAEQALLDSAENFARSRPAMAGMSVARLAELRRHQGRVAEVAQLLERAGPSTSAQLTRARLALDQGDCRAALELVDRQLRKLSAEATLERAPGLELRIRIRAEQGELGAAQTDLDALRQIHRTLQSPRLQAGLERAQGLVALADGRPDAARPLLEDALDRLTDCGAVLEAACARIDLARCLASADRQAEALREARAAATTLRQCGADGDATRAEKLLHARQAAVAEPHGPASHSPGKLTRREVEVLRWVARGHTNREIAHELGVSGHTVHRHMANILRKLDLPSRAAAAAHAAEAGLIHGGAGKALPEK